jgi:calcineurin-like phosphoesterase family protein
VTDTWFTSDHHFGHANMLKFTRGDGTPVRPGFRDVTHMDEEMIARWNDTVKPGDTVHHLGDICFSGEHLKKIVPRLNGRIYLCLGNHDRCDAGLYDKLFYKVRGEFHYKDEASGAMLLCTHFPVHESCLKEKVGRPCLNVHGHIHTRIIDDPRYVNICVEQTDYRPVHYDWLMAKARKLKETENV